MVATPMVPSMAVLSFGTNVPILAHVLGRMAAPAVRSPPRLALQCGGHDGGGDTADGHCSHGRPGKLAGGVWPDSGELIVAFGSEEGGAADASYGSGGGSSTGDTSELPWEEEQLST